MAAGAAKVANPLFAFVFQSRNVHERGIGIGGGLLFFQGDQIAGYVVGILGREAEAGHHRHVLDLEIMAVVRTLAMIKIELEREALLFIIFGTDVLFFVGTIGAGGFGPALDTTKQIVVAAFFRPTIDTCSNGSASECVASAVAVTREQ